MCITESLFYSVGFKRFLDDYDISQFLHQ